MPSADLHTNAHVAPESVTSSEPVAHVGRGTQAWAIVNVLGAWQSAHRRFSGNCARARTSAAKLIVAKPVCGALAVPGAPRADESGDDRTLAAAELDVALPALGEPPAAGPVATVEAKPVPEELDGAVLMATSPLVTGMTPAVPVTAECASGRADRMLLVEPAMAVDTGPLSWASEVDDERAVSSGALLVLAAVELRAVQELLVLTALIVGGLGWHWLTATSSPMPLGCRVSSAAAGRADIASSASAMPSRMACTHSARSTASRAVTNRRSSSDTSSNTLSRVTRAPALLLLLPRRKLGINLFPADRVNDPRVSPLEVGAAPVTVPPAPDGDVDATTSGRPLPPTEGAESAELDAVRRSAALAPAALGLGIMRLDARLCCDPAAPAGTPGMRIVVIMRGNSCTVMSASCASSLLPLDPCGSGTAERRSSSVGS